MKKFRQLIESLPPKTVVFTFGRFNPPTVGHEILINAIKKISKAYSADYVIYVSATEDSKKNPLPVDKKLQYLKLMFPNTNFVIAGGQQRTFMEVAKYLNSKYDNLIMVAGSDRIETYTKTLNDYNGKDYNYNSIKVLSAGFRDPDDNNASGISASKLREFAKAGDFDSFRKYIPSTLRDFDTKRLMNDVRIGLNLDPIKEEIKFEVTDIREQYIAGKIFNIGDMIEHKGSIYEIVGRGSNYLTVIDSNGNLSKKWLQECTQAFDREIIPSRYIPNEISFKGYITKNFHYVPDAVKAFQGTINRQEYNDPVAIIIALRATDQYFNLNNARAGGGILPDKSEVMGWIDAHNKARESLTRIGEFVYHFGYWHTYEYKLRSLMNNYNNEIQGADVSEETMIEEENKLVDKNKVAKIIADMLGVEKSEGMSPDQAVESGLRKIKAKKMTPEFLKVVEKMIKLAQSVGIKCDPSSYPQELKHLSSVNETKINDILDYKKMINVNDEPEDIKPKIGNIKMGESLHNKENETIRHMKIKHIIEDIHTSDNKINGEEKSIKETEFLESYENDYDLSDEELESMAASIDNEDDIIDLYDDEELSIIDDETGEHIDDIREEVILEVLSRMERIRAKIRLKKSESKRERKLKIALRQHSSAKKINERARKLAIKLLKQRILRKNPASFTISDKERVERILAKKKNLIDRLAMKLASRVRKIENERLSHHIYTK